MLTNEQRQLFEDWSYTKNIISIVFRVKPHGFYKELHGFSKPADAALILFCGDDCKQHITPRITEIFDLVLMFDSNRVSFDNVESCDDIIVFELLDLANDLKGLVDLKKMEIHYTDDRGIASVCHFRKLLGLPGPYLDDMNHIRHKDKVLAHAVRNNIPTAKYVAVDFSRLKVDDIPKQIDRIEEKLGPYPFFKRPQCMFGSIGAQPMESREVLTKWMEERIAVGDRHIHLVEEYLIGREFLAVGLMTHSGKYVPLVVKYLEFGWSNVLYISTGRPIPAFVDTFRNTELDEFPNLGEFVDRVITTYKPPPSQIFCIQGFQRSPKKEADYVLVELTPRGTGPRTGSVIYQVAGIDQDTASLMSMIDPNYCPKVDPRRGRPTELMLWFPQQKGVLKEYTDLPGKDAVKSEIKANWLRPLGTVFHKAAANVNSHVVILTVSNPDREQLLEDAKWIADNWRPRLEAI